MTYVSGHKLTYSYHIEIALSNQRKKLCIKVSEEVSGNVYEENYELGYFGSIKLYRIHKILLNAIANHRRMLNLPNSQKFINFEECEGYLNVKIPPMQDPELRIPELQTFKLQQIGGKIVRNRKKSKKSNKNKHGLAKAQPMAKAIPINKNDESIWKHSTSDEV